MKSIISYVKELKNKFQENNIPILAAAQAYYYLLAIVPLLILMLSILPYLQIDPQQAIEFMGSMIPDETMSIFREQIISLVDSPKGGLLTVGIIGTLWSASSGVMAFINSANLAYEVEETRSFIKVRLLSIVLTLGMIVAIAVALVLPVFGDLIIQGINQALNLPGQSVIIFQLLRWAIGIVVMTGILMALYHFAPNKTYPFKHILPGAMITAILWQLISLAFSFYVSNFGSYSATYGSLGGIIILLLWFFLTGLILMIGAEINVLYHKRHAKSSTDSTFSA
ncbi:YihY/virulence factor BrkB family protein [Pontibacillus sp. ALD_SL1]|uniref:YihY/virulence factor BrkB family protein n=1 Tax=Pontibacillus sp. ALD_SL1 TaxID=2777185 RepID=UPI001A9693CE|nr:YihY/virulence factor BrkB family protein [Pontibacillus sp. ALD_SL1]QST01337.1 YihY/virulence factor BrkB family protein [Pontibacillus sp. ALD_SL1]